MNLTTQILFGFIAFVYPASLLLTYRRSNKRLKSDGSFRLTYYKRLTILFWSLTMLVLGNSLTDKLPALNFFPTLNTAGLISAALIFVFIVLQAATSRISTSDKAISVMDKTGDGYHFLPKSNREFVWFTILSVSAGICEEIIFRLFIFSFLLLHTHLATAFLLTNVVFALTHIDVDKRNMVSAFVLGLLFSIIYYISDNIWLAITLHTAIDINMGYLGYQTHKLMQTAAEE